MVNKPSRLCLYTLILFLPRNAVSGRSSFLQFVPLCKMSTWTWLLVISAEQHGANQAVTTLIRPVLLRKHLPTRTFRCLVSGPTYADSSCLPIHMIYGRYAYIGHSQFLEKFWASVKETRAAIMKSGCIWTSSDHERTMIIVHFSKKGPAPIHQPRKKVGMTTEVTIHSHLCRRHVNSCVHKVMLFIIGVFFWLFLRALQCHEHLT